MPTIKVRVDGKIAENLTPEIKIVCGNEDYEVEFQLDEPWSSVNFKTGLFIFNGDLVAQPFDGNVCPMPSIEDTTLLAIGVKSSDGRLFTTTPAFADCLKSASDLARNKIPAPAKDVYDEIIALLNKYIGQGGSSGIDEEAVKQLIKDETAGLQDELSIVNLTLEQSGLLKKYKRPIEQEYSERVTADGLNVLDGSKAVLKKVVGNTVAYDKDENGLNGKLANAYFGGIESTNADGTETSTLSFPKTETPLGTTIDFENKKITDYGVDLVLTGNEAWTYHWNLNINKNGCLAFLAIGNSSNYPSLVSTDSVGAKHSGMEGIAITAARLYWYGILDVLGFTKEGTQATTEEQANALANFKVYLAQRYADGNPVIIRYVSTAVQSETDITADNEYTAYKGGTEKVLDNGGAEYGAENTITQDYILVAEV